MTADRSVPTVRGLECFGDHIGCPRWRIAPRCSLMRNMISTNSEMMRAKITPITTPIKLAMIQNRPPSGLERHQGEAGDDAGEARQRRNADREPVENFDDRRRDEPFPLEQVAKIEHRVPPPDAGVPPMS